MSPESRLRSRRPRSNPIRSDVTEVRLRDEEAKALRAALASLCVKSRTGEVGIMHGADRFVSTQRVLKKPELESLDAAARKLGLGGIRRF